MIGTHVVGSPRGVDDIASAEGMGSPNESASASAYASSGYPSKEDDSVECRYPGVWTTPVVTGMWFPGAVLSRSSAVGSVSDSKEGLFPRERVSEEI